jgi:hypothetical protein
MEGPSPAMELPRVRWDLFPSTPTEVDSPSAETQSLTFSARSRLTVDSGYLLLLAVPHQ